MVQAIGYVRRSTNRQEESLEQQRAKLQNFAQGRGWELVEVYADDAISGSQMHRAGLDSLVEHAERHGSRRRAGVGTQPPGAAQGYRGRLAPGAQLMQAGKRVFYVATGQEADRSFTSGLVGYVEHYQNGDYLRKLSRDAMRGIVPAQQAYGLRAPRPSAMTGFAWTPAARPSAIIRNLPDTSQMVLHPQTLELIEHVKDGHRYTKPEHETVTLIPSEPARVEAVKRLFADYLAGVPFRLLRDRINASGMRTVFGGVFTVATLHQHAAAIPLTKAC